MIQFPCLGCREVFFASDDEAGNSIQCSRCGRLNDIPTHSELNEIADDGTFKLVDSQPPPDSQEDLLADAVHAYRKSRTDDEGYEIDLRNTPEERASVDQTPALEPGQRQRHKPYYDPETGELIRPLELAPDPERDVDPETIPLAVPAEMAREPVTVINYATPGDPELSDPRPLRRLLGPVNLAVMFFVVIALFVGYAVLLLFKSIADQTFDVPIWPLNVMFWLVLAHYGNTIVAIGPEEHDELPRPLLSLELWEDIFGPLFSVLGSALLCYAPMFAALAFTRGIARFSVLPLMVVGGFYFPAVLLTVLTSGSILNLHPDRLRAVIRVGGKRYLRVAALWIVVFPVYVWATLRVNIIFSSLNIESPPWRASEILIAGPAIILTVFLLHYIFWQLGLLFRAGHERFGWVWQELLRQRDEDRKQRGAMTAADRATMRRQRKLRAAAAGQPITPARTRPETGRR